jgi:ABC-type branched-subunit amino acid transport system ATPase component
MTAAAGETIGAPIEALTIADLAGGYGRLTVFAQASFTVKPGETVGILGPNGAGKTTLLKTIMGLLPAHGGSVRVGARDLHTLPAFRRARAGLALVPEGRQILAGLTVGENLELGRAVGMTAEDYRRRVDEVLALFPRLGDRQHQPGGSLSGGEQQMLAIGRALLLAPKVLMLDEPTQGLAPVMVQQVLTALQDLHGRFAMVVVEQNRAFLDALADLVYTMSGGRLVPASPQTLQKASS